MDTMKKRKGNAHSAFFAMLKCDVATSLEPIDQSDSLDSTLGSYKRPGGVDCPSLSSLCWLLAGGVCAVIFNTLSRLWHFNFHSKDILKLF